MPTVLEEHAIERSTYKITFAFVDDAQAACTPNAASWTLTDDAGNVINSRSAVSITPATSVDIVLSGADLAIGDNGRKRIVTIQGTYDSSAGSNLPLKDQVIFYIDDLVIVV